MNRSENHSPTITPASNGHADSATPPACLPLLIDLGELAQKLGICRRSAERLEISGQIGPRRIVLGRSVRFRAAEIEAWIASGCPKREVWSWPAA